MSLMRTCHQRKETAIVGNEGYVYLRDDRKMTKVKYCGIIYVESMKDYVKIVRMQNKPLLVKHSIFGQK